MGMNLGSVEEFFGSKTSLWSHKRLLLCVTVGIILLLGFIKLAAHKKTPKSAKVPQNITHDDEVWYVGEKSSCVCYGNEEEECDPAKCVCAGNGTKFGSIQTQIREVLKFRNKIHPECPLLADTL